MDRVAVCQEQSNYSVLEARTLNPARCPVPVNDLQTLLTRLVDRYGTQRALADAIGIGDSRLTKVLKGASGSLGIKNCLRLAKVAGVSASQILRAANKSDVAELIEDLYGASAQPTLTHDDPMAAWGSDLSPKAKDLLLAFLREVEQKPRRRKRA